MKITAKRLEKMEAVPFATPAEGPDGGYYIISKGYKFKIYPTGSTWVTKEEGKEEEKGICWTFNDGFQEHSVTHFDELLAILFEAGMKAGRNDLREEFKKLMVLE